MTNLLGVMLTLNLLTLNLGVSFTLSIFSVCTAMQKYATAPFRVDPTPVTNKLEVDPAPPAPACRDKQKTEPPSIARAASVAGTSSNESWHRAIQRGDSFANRCCWLI